jgi:multicomponent Na+:H+ antiporter subunit C
MVGMLFASGTYLLLRRQPIKLILGLSLLSYGANVFIFSTGSLHRGLPPIIADTMAASVDVSRFVDPMPQALILTAIVINFGVTAFIVVLVNRRNALLGVDSPGAAPEDSLVANDPFAAFSEYLSGRDADPEDYEWLEDSWRAPPLDER